MFPLISVNSISPCSTRKWPHFALPSLAPRKLFLSSLNWSENTNAPSLSRAAGHSAVVGTSNVPNGLVIDLLHLDHIEIAEDKQTVSLGPGSRWGSVYEELEKQHLSVVGGRVSSVGVGGFIMGGMVSYSATVGFLITNFRRNLVPVVSPRMGTGQCAELPGEFRAAPPYRNPISHIS